MIVRKHELATEFLYQPMVRKGVWGDTSKRYSNTTECPAPGFEGFTYAVDSYKKTYGGRKPAEYIWDHEFEGIWGYRWTDLRTILRITTTNVSEQEV